jgi:hypothetical protein
VRPLASIKLCPFSKPANQFGWIILAKDTDLGEIGLGRLLWQAVFALLDTLRSLPAPNPTLETWREGVLYVELEEIVGAMGILGVLHNVATGKVSPDCCIGETQLDRLVVITHGNIDTAKAPERTILNGCEVHVQHLDSNKLEEKRDEREEQ